MDKTDFSFPVVGACALGFLALVMLLLVIAGVEPSKDSGSTAYEMRAARLNNEERAASSQRAFDTQVQIKQYQLKNK